MGSMCLTQPDSLRTGRCSDFGKLTIFKSYNRGIGRPRVMEEVKEGGREAAEAEGQAGQSKPSRLMTSQACLLYTSDAADD